MPSSSHHHTRRSSVLSRIFNRIAPQDSISITTRFNHQTHSPHHPTTQARHSILRRRRSSLDEKPIRAVEIRSGEHDEEDFDKPYLGNARQRPESQRSALPLPFISRRSHPTSRHTLVRPPTPFVPQVPLDPPLTPPDFPSPFATLPSSRPRPQRRMQYQYPYVQYTPYLFYPPYVYVTPNGAQSGWPASAATSTVPLPTSYPVYTSHLTQQPYSPPTWPTNAISPAPNFPNSAGSHHAPLPPIPGWNTPRPFRVNIPDEGTLTWEPHPHPHPSVPAQTWWAPILGTSITVPPIFTHGQALALSGGWPLPGQGPRDFIAGDTWPPRQRRLPLHIAPWLIPNPVDADSNTIRWDIRFPPSTNALHLTGRAYLRHAAKSLDVDATYPASKEMLIVPQWFGNQSTDWGVIHIQQSKDITCMDVLFAIYDYFSTPVTEDELGELMAEEKGAYDVMVNSMFERCCETPGLFEYERRKGLKRVDAMGGTTMFWGMWTAIDLHTNQWRMNLGLTPRNGPR